MAAARPVNKQKRKGANGKVVLFIHIDMANKQLLKDEAVRNNLSMTQLVENVLGRYLQKAAARA